MKSKPHIFKPQELRPGIQLNYDTGEGIAITTVDWQDIKWLTEKPDNFHVNHSPIVLTEPLMKRVRRIYNDEKDSCIEFSMTPPGERQVDNNWWSREIHDFRILHLSPSYSSHNGVKHEAPDFWHCWICAHGTGSNWFLDVRHYKLLKYFHQLQNLFFGLCDQELIIKP
jgi:hypothetical protein